MNRSTFTPEMAQNAVQKAYAETRNWRAVGRLYRMSAGMAYRVAHGYEPKDAHIRQALGLPVYAPAPVCAVHGVVHCYDCSTHQPKAITQPGKPRQRRAINLTNPVSAAATILAHMSRENIERLKELLEIP